MPGGQLHQPVACTRERCRWQHKERLGALARHGGDVDLYTPRGQQRQCAAAQDGFIVGVGDEAEE